MRRTKDGRGLIDREIIEERYKKSDSVFSLGIFWWDGWYFWQRRSGQGENGICKTIERFPLKARL